jgi:ribonuclease P protein subunit RPR2
MAETLNNLRGEQELNETRQIALQRIRTLFRLAKEKIRESPQLSQRYVEIARKIAMRTKLQLPKEYRYTICRHCKKFIYPGVNCRVRLQQKRKSHIVKTCLICGKITRMPLNPGRRKKEKKAA